MACGFYVCLSSLGAAHVVCFWAAAVNVMDRRLLYSGLLAGDFFFLSHFIMGVDRRFRLCSARFRVVHLLSVLTEVSNGLVDGASCGLSEILEVCVGLIETSLYDCMALSDYTFVQMHARASRRKMNWLGILDTHVSITAFDHPSTSSANAAPCAGTSILILGEAPLVPI